MVLRVVSTTSRQSVQRERCCSRSSSHAGVEGPVEIARQFEYDFLAVHCDSLRRKYLFSFWRSFKPRPQEARFYRRHRNPQEFARSLRSKFLPRRAGERPRGKSDRARRSLELRISLSSVWANRCSGEGPQSSISRKTESSSSVSGSSRDTWLGRRLRSFIRASLTAMRTSQV